MHADTHIPHQIIKSDKMECKLSKKFFGTYMVVKPDFIFGITVNIFIIYDLFIV